MRILLINGINTHGEKNVDRFIPPLTELGYEVIDIKLPKRNFITARWKYKKDVQQIMKNARDGDSVICHSHGGNRARKVMPFVRFRNVFMFRPAMSRHVKFDGRSNIYCIHSKQDLAIWLGSVLLFHKFGLAGVYGFTQKAMFVKNEESHGDHGHDFDPIMIDYWVNYIHSVLKVQNNAAPL